MVRQLHTNKFPGLFKDKDLFNKSAFFNPLLNTLLAKTRHGVIYDFYFLAMADHISKILLMHKNVFRQSSEFQGFLKI